MCHGSLQGEGAMIRSQLVKGRSEQTTIERIVHKNIHVAIGISQRKGSQASLVILTGL